MEKRVWKREADLRLAMLRELASSQSEASSMRGLSPKRLLELLQLPTPVDMVASLCLLNEVGFVDAADGKFVITDSGLKYLSDLENGLAPGDWPPHSRVPRRPLPGLGSGQLALPLPETSEDQI